MKSLTTIAAALLAIDASASSFDAAALVLEANCLSCHNPSKIKGELLLDTREALLNGGEYGPSIEPGNPAESLLYTRAALPHDDDDIMPPKGETLTGQQLASLHTWIADGAPWPEGKTLSPRAQNEVPRKLEDDKPLRSLAVYPPDINLETSLDTHRIVVTATYEDDTTRDVTVGCDYTIANPALANFDRFAFTPKADGKTVTKITYRDKSIDLPVVVTSATAPRPVSFKLDVMPIFMREGCNTGSCHGSARGQDRFMLSLFGYDPDGDYQRITRQQNGRRINLAIPAESALLEKSIEAVPHSGAKLFGPDSPSYNTILSWLENGALKDPDDVATPTGIELYPKKSLLEGEGNQQQMTVRATYSDGTDRDVTNLAVFITNNELSAAVTEDGVVTSGVRGEAFIMARFAEFTVGSDFVVIPENLDYTRPEIPAANFIDELVSNKLHKLRIYPSDICSDEVFLRRAFLDIVGMLPSNDEIAAFVADATPDKRTRLVDDLLSRKEFVEMWVMKFAELLQIRSVNQGNNRVSYKAALLYHNWLKDKFARNVPMNEIVKEILSATGGTFSNPATNYYQTETDNLKVSENVAQVFMGMRLQCAQCHNHPFDRWTQNDYYGWAAFFTQIGRKQAEDPRETIVYNRGGGEVQHPITKVNAIPKYLGGAAPTTKGKDRREALVEWLASPENPFFAKNLANIVWSHFFGQGIIEPVDDVRVSNPASNPELLEELGSRFTAYNYDFKKLVRDICTSRTYQLSTQPNDSNGGDTRNFARQTVRRLRAEILLDAISQVTETKNKFKGLPLGARAVQIADGNTSSYFLTTFGRAKRETVCSCEVKMDPNLGQALHLINGSSVHNNINSGGVTKRLVEQKLSHDQIVESLYLRTFARKPTEIEIKALQDRFEESGKENPQAFYEDLFWALLNAKEFIFNH
ncbi:MAG: PSD1 and planctomycete cytochrome C domain-containing protein [Verrucomicrobiales bacterium]|nr:PSD1 and planctomycete cytochrome C domain-containing protein [Verrucomicrobiales bacterium]